MRNQRLSLFLLAVFCTMARVANAQPANPAPPEPTRIIIEAEDMKGVDQKNFGPGKKWQVGRWGDDLYQNMIFGGVWASRLRVAMADAGNDKAEAYQDIDVPADATYKVWAKYECPPYFNYAFGIRIEPRGGGSAVYDKTYGLIESPKHYCFTDDVKTGSLYWNWGIDHDAAEGYEVPLKKGRYRVTLYKTNNPRPAGARSVDTIMLTTDLTKNSAPRMPRYPLLDELRRANHVYFRFHNNGAQPVRIDWNHWNHRYPDFYQPFYRELVKFYDDGGKELAGGKNGDWQQPIPAGGVSPWYDLGPTMNVESSSPFMARARAIDAKGVMAPADAPSAPFSFDIALEPNSKKVLKTLALGPGETELSFLVQPDLQRPEGVKATMKNADIYADITRQLNATPRLGPVPRQIKLYAGTGYPSFGTVVTDKGPSWDFEYGRAFRDALGLNTVGAGLNRKEIDYILQRAAKVNYPLISRSVPYHHSQDPAAIIEQVKKAGVEDYFDYLSYGDEIGLPSVDVKDVAKVNAFRDYVKAQGETPESLGLTNWEQVKPLDALSADIAVQIGVLPENAPKNTASIDKLKRLYWYSTRFRIRSGINDFAAKTAQLKAGLGNNVQGSANLGGMHPFFWMHQSSFIDSFKGNAMSLAWSEDYTYCQPEASYLVEDFEASYLRKGASYHDTPTMFYCMPHYPGNTPERLLQDAVMLWGQNIKHLDFFTACPDIWSTENYITYRGGLPMWQSMRTISGMAGAIENDLMPARTAQTPVAMLLSETSDLWEVGGKSQGAVEPGSVETNISQEERKNTWYALRKAGYRVDFVTEDDVKEGLLKNYKALYVCGQNLERKAADIIKQWVNDGGILYGTAGAARKNEFDEPLTTLDAVFGRGAQTSYNRYHGPLRAKMELLFQKPLDRVAVNRDVDLMFPVAPPMPPYSTEALGSKETTAVAADATVLAKYNDGQAAWIWKKFGQGVGYYTGALPGQSYIREGMPFQPVGKGGSGDTNFDMFEPQKYDITANAMILYPLRKNGILPDTLTGHHNVVASRLVGPASTVLPIVNLAQRTEGTLKNVQVTVKGIDKAPSKVWSPFHPKGIPFKQSGDGIVLTLPTLEAADVVVISQ